MIKMRQNSFKFDRGANHGDDLGQVDIYYNYIHVHCRHICTHMHIHIKYLYMTHIHTFIIILF